MDAETRAWADGVDGFDRGDLRFAAAAGHFRNALAVSPGNPLAFEAWGETEAARGNQRAIAFQRQAVAKRFSLEFAASLGDLTVAGKQQAAAKAYDLVQRQEKQLAANGVDTDVDRAMFQLEHGIDLRGSLGLARRG